MTTTIGGFVLADPHQSGSFLISEAKFWRSRDAVILAQGQSLGFGTVLGQIGSTGRYVASSKTATDGSQNATCILWEDTDATAGDVKVGVVARECEVFAGSLSYDLSVVTSADQQAKWAQLALQGIIVREFDDPQARAANQLDMTLGW